MKKIILFIILAVLILLGASMLNGRLDEDAKQEVLIQAEKNKEAEMKMMEGFEKTDILIGQGREAKVGDTVSVQYRGFFKDTQKEFDSSYKNGKPFIFSLGAGRVIKGWELGIPGMKIGGKRRLTIPPALAYGSVGQGDIIPPNATLVFDIVLEEVQ